MPVFEEPQILFLPESAANGARLPRQCRTGGLEQFLDSGPRREFFHDLILQRFAKPVLIVAESGRPTSNRPEIATRWHGNGISQKLEVSAGLWASTPRPS